jgi:hypothetical protein
MLGGIDDAERDDAHRQRERDGSGTQNDEPGAPPERPNRPAHFMK